MLIFSYGSVKTFVLCAQKNRLIQTVLLSTHNTCFGREIRKLNFTHSYLEACKLTKFLLKVQYILVVFIIKMSYIHIILCVVLLKYSFNYAPSLRNKTKSVCKALCYESYLDILPRKPDLLHANNKGAYQPADQHIRYSFLESITLYPIITPFDAFEVSCIWKYYAKRSICSFGTYAPLSIKFSRAFKTSLKFFLDFLMSKNRK